MVEQSDTVVKGIESAASTRDGAQQHRRDSACYDDEYSEHKPTTLTRLVYLASHLDALRSTLSVLLQTLYTAQSIMWSK